MTKEKAMSLDKTLEMFRGNVSHSYEDIRNDQQKLYGNLDKVLSHRK